MKRKVTLALVTVLVIISACNIYSSQDRTPTVIDSVTKSAITETPASPVEYGGRIAYYSDTNSGICIMFPVVERIQGIDDRVCNKIPVSQWSADPDWSPSGEKIAFTSGDDSVGYNIFIMNADGTNVMQLTQGRHNWGFPNWSPDGTRIVFSAGDKNVEGKIMVINSDGSGLTTLYDTWPAEYPAWSPDGLHIAFAAWSEGSFPKIFIMNSDGTGVKQITNPEWLDTRPAWSPDGNFIVFSRETDGQTGDTYLFITNADGTNVRILSDETLSASYSTWSPDGKYIAFSDESGQLWVIEADGTGIYSLKIDGRDPSWTR